MFLAWIFLALGQQQFCIDLALEALKRDKIKEPYRLTDRSLRDHQLEWNNKLFRTKPLEGTRVLDIGSGGVNKFVRELRDLGIEAYGLDIVKYKAKAFVQANAFATPFRSQSFDHVFSSWSLPFYDGGSPELMEPLFMEVARILRVGGTFTIYPVYKHEASTTLREAAQKFGFSLHRHGDYQTKEVHGSSWDFTQRSGGLLLEFKKDPE